MSGYILSQRENLILPLEASGLYSLKYTKFEIVVFSFKISIGKDDVIGLDSLSFILFSPSSPRHPHSQSHESHIPWRPVFFSGKEKLLEWVTIDNLNAETFK